MSTSKISRPWQSLFPDFSGKNAGFHNSIWRGKSLGNSLSIEQRGAIYTGEFTDMFCGDYWEFSDGSTWVIMGFDCYLGVGPTSNRLELHHVVVVPDLPLYNTKWNAIDNTVTGGPDGGAGYVGSLIRQNIKSGQIGAAEGAEAMAIDNFGDDYVLPYKAVYPNAYDSDGYATGFANYDARVELMTAEMVFGHQGFTGDGHGNGYESGVDKSQLPGFRLQPNFAHRGADWWLRNVMNASRVCAAGSLGTSTRFISSDSKGVRPFALIGVPSL